MSKPHPTSLVTLKLTDGSSLTLVPLLEDNYSYILHKGDTTLVVDPSTADKIVEICEQNQWVVTTVLCTHHHWDHVGGAPELKAKYNCPVYTSKYDLERVPGSTHTFDKVFTSSDFSKTFSCGDFLAEVIDIPGHTFGHVALYFRKQNLLFSGDTLFSLGCGRLFEGTHAQLYTSLKRLCELPPETQILCGHEYTLRNGKFALTIEPNNLDLQKRIVEAELLIEARKPTLPTTLAQELKTNPFLRASDLAQFTQLRLQRDTF